MADSTLDALDNIARLALSAGEWQARAEAADAELLAVRETLAGVIDERNEARAEVSIQREAASHYHEQWTAALADVERLRAQVAEARALLLLAQPAYNAPMLWSKHLGDWMAANTR